MRTSPMVTADVDALPLAGRTTLRDTPATVQPLAPFLAFLALLLIFRSIILDWNQVPTGSMAPTIAVGDHIVVDKLAYDLRVPFTHHSLWRRAEPSHGDIVAFTSPVDGTLYVKRVIGIPGDTVALIGDVLVVNGTPARFAGAAAASGRLQIQEQVGGHRHLIRLHGTPPERSDFGPVTVPPGAFLLLGDNRHESFDSRHFGFVDRGRILGRATTVAFSLDYDRSFRPRPDRLWSPLH